MATSTPILRFDWPGAADVLHFIRIPNFGLKMRLFRKGQPLTSNPIKVGSSNFAVKIYPAGSKDSAKGNVSIYICNISEWGVEASYGIKVKGTWKMQPMTNRFNNVRNEGPPGSFWGWGREKFVSHDICHKGKDGILDSDETLELEVRIKLIKEEVTGNAKMNPSDQNKLTEVKQELKEVKQDLKKKHENPSDQNKLAEVMQELKEVKQDLKKIHESLESLEKKLAKKPSELQCSFCSLPRMRLRKCRNGHVICDTCLKKAKEQGRAIRGGKHCHKCRSPMNKVELFINAP